MDKGVHGPLRKFWEADQSVYITRLLKVVLRYLDHAPIGTVDWWQGALMLVYAHLIFYERRAIEPMFNVDIGYLRR